MLLAALWTSLNISLLATIIILLFYSKDNRCLMGPALLIGIFFAPTLELLHVGQINLVVLFFIAACYLLRDRYSRTSALMLAIAILVKVTPVVFVGLFIVKKRYVIVAWCIGWLVGIGVLTDMLFPSGLWRDYFEMNRWLIEQYPVGSNSFSFSAIFSDILVKIQMIPLQVFETLSHKQIQYGWIFINGMIWLGCLALHFAIQPKSDVMIWISTAVFMTISPNILWFHHFVFLLFPMMIAYQNCNNSGVIKILAAITLLAIQCARMSHYVALSVHCISFITIVFCAVRLAVLLRERTQTIDSKLV
jgi:hypothetical protein